MKQDAFATVAAGDEDQEHDAGGEGDGLASQDLVDEELLPDRLTPSP